MLRAGLATGYPVPSKVALQCFAHLAEQPGGKRRSSPAFRRPGFLHSNQRFSQLPTARSYRLAAALALYLTLAACSTPQTVIVHQPAAPPLSEALLHCQDEPPIPSRDAGTVPKATWLGAAIYAGRDCRNVLGKLVAVIEAWRDSIKETK